MSQNEESSATFDEKNKKMSLTEEEKKLLLDLVGQYKSIINCTEKKADINKRKNETWDKVRLILPYYISLKNIIIFLKITAELNKSSQYKRETSLIKKAYKNIVYRSKVAITKFKKEIKCVWTYMLQNL